MVVRRYDGRPIVHNGAIVVDCAIVHPAIGLDLGVWLDVQREPGSCYAAQVHAWHPHGRRRR